MFQNLIPVILVLLAYESQTPGPATGPYSDVVLAAAVSLCLFAVLSRLRFFHLFRRIVNNPGPLSAAAYDRVFAGQTVLAMAMCAGLLYFTDIKALLQATAIARKLPTMGSLGFVALFLAHLAVSWAFAYPAYRTLHPDISSRREFLRGNMALSIPALLPWFAISILLDALRLLPWPAFSAFIASPAGEISFFLAFLLAVAIFGPVMIARFWGCKPLEPGFARTLMEGLCDRAGVRCQDILTWPIFGGGLLTAGVMGLVGRFRYVLVTPGLLRTTSEDELSAVLAHEIGHVRGRHLWLYLVLLSLFGVFAYGAEIMAAICAELWVTGVSKLVTLPAAFFRPPGEVFSQVVLIAGFLIYFRFFFGFFMRLCERDADLFVFTGLARPEALTSCLAKIAFLTGRDPDEPNWHHFGIGERIRFIEAAMADTDLIARHKRKLGTAFVAAMCFLALMGGIGYFFDATGPGRKAMIALSEMTMSAGVASHPRDPILAASLATLYLSQKQCARSADLFRKSISLLSPDPDAYPQLKGAGVPPASVLNGLLADALLCAEDESGAVKAYEESLLLFPENAESANNLAWTLATSRNPDVRDPERALIWARRAADLLPEPFVLDTLAECLYANGMYDEAISVEEQALAGAAANKDIYRKQLAKFKAATSGI